ncbi:hypothetical protein [Alphaproteobacteria bacterium endosymbiont of Tiliacea citrago]|uniref:hypothetical protein n=1 Tax=Alphaproteobacteria bacterium endosymbiont of Tiliacea citrago TaxID=3077944 RepID=UPI00313D98AB
MNIKTLLYFGVLGISFNAAKTVTEEDIGRILMEPFFKEDPLLFDISRVLYQLKKHSSEDLTSLQAQEEGMLPCGNRRLNCT